MKPYYVDRSLIQNKLNLPQKQECHQCHNRKSAKYMSITSHLCETCAARLEKLKQRRKRQADNMENRYVWLKKREEHRVWLADRKKKQSA